MDVITKNLGWPYEPFPIPKDVKGVNLVIVTTEVLKPKSDVREVNLLQLYH